MCRVGLSPPPPPPTTTTPQPKARPHTCLNHSRMATSELRFVRSNKKRTATASTTTSGSIDAYACAVRGRGGAGGRAGGRSAGVGVGSKCAASPRSRPCAAPSRPRAAPRCPHTDLVSPQVPHAHCHRGLGLCNVERLLEKVDTQLNEGRGGGGNEGGARGAVPVAHLGSPRAATDSSAEGDAHSAGSR